MSAQIPPAVRAALGHAEHGRETGGFVRAVLCNDLSAAVAHADSESLAALPEIVRYVYNDLPSKCWGSQDKVAAWSARVAKGVR